MDLPWSRRQLLLLVEVVWAVGRWAVAVVVPASPSFLSRWYWQQWVWRPLRTRAGTVRPRPEAAVSWSVRVDVVTEEEVMVQTLSRCYIASRLTSRWCVCWRWCSQQTRLLRLCLIV